MQCLCIAVASKSWELQHCPLWVPLLPLGMVNLFHGEGSKSALPLGKNLPAESVPATLALAHIDLKLLQS
jgi:hypothetical protein